MQVIALREDTDVDPPWLVQCVVINQGKGPAGTFKVRLTLYDGAKFGSKPFWWCTHTITGPKAFGSKLPAGASAVTEFQLPVGFKHTDFGPNNIYVLTIEGPADESEANNNTFSSMELPPLLKESSGPPPSPEPWRMSLSGVEGRRKVMVRLQNAGIKPTKATQLDLHLRLPKPGAATGNPILAGSTKIPAMQPGEERSVTLVGVRDFLAPQRGVVLTDPIVTGRRKAVKFKPLVPFSLSIKGSGSEMGFGPIAGDPKGKIKFPGKK